MEFLWLVNALWLTLIIGNWECDSEIGGWKSDESQHSESCVGFWIVLWLFFYIDTWPEYICLSRLYLPLCNFTFCTFLTCYAIESSYPATFNSVRLFPNDSWNSYWAGCGWWISMSSPLADESWELILEFISEMNWVKGLSAYWARYLRTCSLLMPSLSNQLFCWWCSPQF